MTKLHVTPDSPISVELIKYNHHPGARTTVVITWPSHATECTPAKFAQVVSDAWRILGSLNRASAPSHRGGTAMINSRHTV
jgi:hypothetical protein